MKEYDRPENVNTPVYWNSAWKRRPEVGADKDPVRDRVMELLPDGPVHEYGFGGLHLARKVGADRWVGRDFSDIAVRNAKAEGFTADVIRCRDADINGAASVVAIEVLEHLDSQEMDEFLLRCQWAPVSFFSVPGRFITRDQEFKPHLRGWESKEDFADFLLPYFPQVRAQRVGRWLLAHCKAVAE